MGQKYYFEGGTGGELCYSLQYFKDKFVEGECNSPIYLAESKVDYGSGFYFCTENEVVGEVGDGNCGVVCRFYKPRNGKNGRCRFSINTREYSGRYFRLDRYLKLTEITEAEFQLLTR